MGYGSFLIPRFYGWITFAACLAVAFTVLCRVEVLMTAARWLCIISALRSIVVMILIRMNFTFELYALYGIGLILSVLLAFMIYANED